MKEAKQCGGQATSVPTQKCNIPYAWRIWSNFYYNFMDIVKNIPLDNSSTGKIIDNFIVLPSYSHEVGTIKGRNIEAKQTLDIRNFTSKKEYYKIVLRLCNAFLMSDEKLKEDDITFYDYIDPQEKSSSDWILEFVGPIIGVEATKATLYCVIKGWAITYGSWSLDNGFTFTIVYVTNGPYDEVIFNPWVKYLVNQGVKIFTETPVLKINYSKDNNTINSITTKYGESFADDYILCLDQTALSKLIKTNIDLLKFPELEKASRLMLYGNQIYFGMIIYFNEEFEIKFNCGCAQDELWKPVIQNFRTVWKDKYVKKCNSVEILQVSCLDLVKGHNGKYLRECSVEEIVTEIFLQLKQTIIFRNLKSKSGKYIWDTVSGYDIWPDWKTSKDGKLYNVKEQYKLSINKHCWDLMPDIKTSITNLFIGSVIAKGDTPMVSMEMACSNGRTAAHTISEKYNAPAQKIFNHPGLLPIILSPIRNLDKLFFNMGLKVNWIIVIFIVIFIIIFIIILCIILLIVVFIRKIIRHKTI